MNGILLTQNGGFLGPIAKVLGYIMEGIFNVIDYIGIPNIGLAIILFTIVVNLLMMPLTIKQQKFSKLSAKMQPEIQAIQAKYKNRKDNASQMAQSQEIQGVYAKYGVSATGSCVQLLIQMPILFALYRVIYAIPAYVSKIGDVFRVLADKIISVDNAEFLKNSGINTIQSTVAAYGKSMNEGNMQNGIVDVLNRLSTSDMATIADHYDLSQLTYEGELILSNDTTRGLIDTFNNFLGINMGNSPWYTIKEAWEAGAWLVLIGALAIPVLSAVTQWINTKLMPTANSDNNRNGNDTAGNMAESMKTMNKIMPFMSAWFCFTLPAGMGIYWVAGSVVRSIQQIFVNKYIDKNLDMNKIIEKNAGKSAKKMEKMKKQQEIMNAYSTMNTKNIKANQVDAIRKGTISGSSTSNTNKQNNPAANNNNNVAPKKSGGSMMSKANMVKDFNERNNK